MNSRDVSRATQPVLACRSGGSILGGPGAKNGVTPASGTPAQTCLSELTTGRPGSLECSVGECIQRTRARTSCLFPDGHWCAAGGSRTENLPEVWALSAVWTNFVRSAATRHLGQTVSGLSRSLCQTFLRKMSGGRRCANVEGFWFRLLEIEDNGGW